MKSKPNTQHRAFSAITHIYDAGRQSWALWMDRQWQRLGSRAKKVAFAFFVCLSVSASVFLMMPGETNGTIRLTLRPDVIQTITVPNSQSTMPDKVPPVLRRIKRFEYYIDSLSATADGRAIRDSIFSARPGLLDSIRLAKSLYDNQN